MAGRPTELGEFRSTVKLSIALPNGKKTTCSGFVVEGCVLTAAHCTSKVPGAVLTMSEGSDPWSASTVISAVETWGDGKVPEFDLAVLKPYVPPMASFGHSRADFSVNPPLPKDILYVAGYGLSESKVGADGVRRNIGIGEKRWGRVRVTNFSTDGSDELDQGPLVVHERAPQIIAPGDSGGYAINATTKRIEGVATVVHPEYALRDGEQPPKGDLLVDNITRGYHVSISHPRARRWLDGAMSKLGCRGNTREGVMLATRDIIRDNFNPVTAEKDWDKGIPKQRVVDRLIANLKRLANIESGERFSLENPKYEELAYEFRYIVGEEAMPNQTGIARIEIDTAKITFVPEAHSTFKLPVSPFEEALRNPGEPPFILPKFEFPE